ncbi:Hypothetical predicted protein [Mytilus galloprovincialis]|uniref:Uncharacterized protein n=1 Tax=Mytilus galloprovincialis TaxID=29158 RepID=A0A8B6DET5_MYTGA|nr:Hypothetical predicted protein [Mytilus galloprovincialis]
MIDQQDEQRKQMELKHGQRDRIGTHLEFVVVGRYDIYTERSKPWGNYRFGVEEQKNIQAMQENRRVVTMKMLVKSAEKMSKESVMKISCRLGLSNIQQPLWQSADARHRREFVQQEVRRGEEERSTSKSLQVDCRGFVSQTFWRAFGSLELIGPWLEKLGLRRRKPLVGYGGREKSSGRASWLLANCERRTP